MSQRILVVDDEEIVIRSCQRALEAPDRTIDTARGGQEALERIESGGYDVIVLDIMMPGIDGLDVLQRAKETHPELEIVMVTGLSQIDTAVRSMKLGAFDYLPKPFDPDELRLVVERALERRRLLHGAPGARPAAGAHYRFDNIIGNSAAMQEVFRLVAQCAPTNTTVLITGESGTGKELVARAIHYNSLRKDKPIVAVDCTALSENLLESELFGHVRGAFTGAVAQKRGLLEVAQGGTLFLDEIGNIPLSIQAKLLRVIQEREFKAVGDTRTQGANVRIIAATNKDLRAMVAEGTFRDDLYYRINIFPIRVPSLRERRADIAPLAFHFLAASAAELGKKVDQFSDGALNVLVNHDWPGNVRELENAVQRAVILATDRVVRKAHLDLGGGEDAGADVPRNGDELKRSKKAAREKSVESIEKAFILEALRRNDWNVTRSALETGMQRPNFQALMKKHNVRLRGTPQPEEE
ncbi:MAG TPA: sigma-54 dependent transcriptional regulator [Usitatibacter sp.]|nr:sigma-54 dependent transcriptional regulator [Usitatibacter sp.]